MIEQTFKIPSTDEKSIYYIKSQMSHSPARKIVLTAHGITGNPKEFIHQMARNYFLERGYDVCRMAFYWGENDARKLQECDLNIHAADMNQVIQTLKNDYDEIYVAGHSYGGTTLLYACPEVNALAFWDPAALPSWPNKLMSFPDCQVQVYPSNGVMKIIGQKMIEEAKSFTSDFIIGNIKDIRSPSVVLLAEAEYINNKETNRKMIYDYLVCEKELHFIPEADHCFTYKMTITELLEKTYNWFERF